MEILEFFKEQGRKGGKIGGRRQKQTATPEQLAAWGRKGGKTAGRGRPKKPKKIAARTPKE